MKIEITDKRIEILVKRLHDPSPLLDYYGIDRSDLDKAIKSCIDIDEDTDSLLTWTEINLVMRHIDSGLKSAIETYESWEARWGRGKNDAPFRTENSHDVETTMGIKENSKGFHWWISHKWWTLYPSGRKFCNKYKFIWCEGLPTEEESRKSLYGYAIQGRNARVMINERDQTNGIWDGSRSAYAPTVKD
ncbi:MAG: hypothetical protein JWN86_1756 [Planctomycetota bacterium]|nr:hypothetical protein [Planctomycetota bacterium]